jgi:hypothetical protein
VTVDAASATASSAALVPLVGADGASNGELSPEGQPSSSRSAGYTGVP